MSSLGQLRDSHRPIVGSDRPDGSNKELLSRLVTYFARNACQTNSQYLQDSEGDPWGFAVLSEGCVELFWISRQPTSSVTLANEWIWVMEESILYVLVANIESEILVNGKSDIFPANCPVSIPQHGPHMLPFDTQCKSRGNSAD